MSPLVSIAPELSQKAALYRTLDFFSAASMITGSKLMFSRTDTFNDKNEGIDRLLRQLEAELPGGGCGGMGWSDARTARREHDKVKRSHYVSCWSQNPESVAMWSLYSPDYCSVRVSTTVSKLLPAVEALVEKYSIARLATTDLGTRVVVATEGRIEPVTYASLPKISARIARRASARQRLRDQYVRHGRTMPPINEVDPRYWQREDQRRFRELSSTCRLKDSSFSHEAEVRLSVRLGEECCTESMFEEQHWLDPEHQFHILIREHLRSWGWVSTADLPEREFVDCPSNLIDTVAIDPRCPGHKASFMTEWFRAHGIQVVNSTCFGYLPESFSVFPAR